MDSLTFSPNLLISLLMDNQGGASSSILVNIVLGYPELQENVRKLWTTAQF
jgi:hypothetical protein